MTPQRHTLDCLEIPQPAGRVLRAGVYRAPDDGDAEPLLLLGLAWPEQPWIGHEAGALRLPLSAVPDLRRMLAALSAEVEP